MELTETIDTINKQLISLFGIDTVTGKAMWRVVWSNDQFEKRHGTFEDRTSSGLFIREVTETRLVPKYRSFIQDKYILEHLVGIPEVNMQELPCVKMSYENIWTFEDKFGRYLPPRIDACQFVINLVESAVKRHKDGLTPIKKYIDDEYSQEASLEVKANRLNEICEALYGEDAAFHDSKLEGSTVLLGDTKCH